MNLIVLFFTSWAVGFSGAASPGPISTFCLTEGSRRGFWAGPRLTLGHALIELAMVILLALGLGPFLSQKAVTAAIALVGGAFLLWMGIDLTRGAWTGKLALDVMARTEPKGLLALGSVPAGALISLSNPYWFLWWATIGASYVLSALAFGVLGLAAFYVGHILADLVWNSLLTFIASSGRLVISPAFYRWLLVAFGVFLVVFSAYFLASGVSLLKEVMLAV